jgi:predicted nucleotide-binding protein
MRNRLAVSREEAASRIDRHIDRGELLLDEAPGDDAEWKDWTRLLEQWLLLGRNMLATTFEATNEADEFYDAVALRAYVNGQTDKETFAGEREAIERGLNILRSLREGLEYAPEPLLSPATTALTPEATESQLKADHDRKVFVVHGRNVSARDGIFDFIRAIGLHPIDWSEAVALTGKGMPYIGEVLDAAFTEAKAVVVLMTPDEVAYLRPEYAHDPNETDLEPRGQPRPNVLFEAGMALGRHQDRTIVVQLGDLREFSDIAGRHAIRLGGVEEREEIAKRLATAGCNVDLSGEEWKSAGTFAPPPPLDVQLPDAPAPVAPVAPGEPEDTTVRVTTRYESGSRPGAGVLTLVNEGSEDLYDVRFELPDAAGTSFWVAAELPISVLPAGAGAGFVTARTMGHAADHFELPVTARTADGTRVTTSAFVNLVV